MFLIKNRAISLAKYMREMKSKSIDELDFKIINHEKKMQKKQ